jgi:endoglucanase
MKSQLQSYFRRMFVVATMSVIVASVAFAQGTGYWHTSGNKIIDSNGNTVRMAGINWYGFETTDYLAHGLWAQDYKTVLNTIKSLGYNVIRIPFSNQMVESDPVPTNFTTSANGVAANAALVGQTALTDLDTIIAYAGSIGLRVILDNHRSEAGSSNEANGLWYTSAYPQSSWINDWTTLATRYSASTFTFNGNPTVIGMDLRNEPHLIANGAYTGGCWTGDTETNGSYTGCPASLSAQNWPVAAEAAGNAILAVNPKLLIFVEGNDCYNTSCGWQGGNLIGVATNPVVLNISGQLVYSAHDYGPNLFQQSWFNSSTTAASLDAVWNKYWAYISADGTAPVWLGEFGTDNTSTDIENTAAGSQGQWFQSLVSFLSSNPAISWTYWALNGEDSYALLDSNYDSTPVSATKQSLLASIQFPLSGGTSCTTVPSAPAGLTATAVSSSGINLSWTAVTPPTNCTISSYSVFRSTTSGFTPSSSNQVGTATGTTFSNTGLTASTTYFFKVEAVDAAGSSAASAQASATTSAGSSCTTVPSAPAGLTATAVSSNGINLSWTAVTPPTNCTISSYTVFRSTTSGFTPSSNNQIATVTSGTTFSDTGLTASTTYYYKVEAVDAAGSSAASAQASATTSASTGGFACHIAYSVTNQWPGGFQAAITINNTGTTGITNWTLTWSFANSQTITQLWNGTESQSGANVTVTNLSYNGTIAAGGNYNGMGFTGTWNNTTNAVPASFAINGTTCN